MLDSKSEKIYGITLKVKALKVVSHVVRACMIFC